MDKMEQEIGKMVEALVAEVAKIEHVSDRMRFWQLLKERTISESSKILLAAHAPDLSEKLAEAQRQIDIIASPYKGRPIPADAQKRVQEDAQAVLYNLGSTGKVVISGGGVTIFATRAIDDDGALGMATVDQMVERALETIADDNLPEMLPSDTRDFLVAVTHLIGVLVKLPQGDRDKELRAMSKLIKLRQGVVESRYGMEG